MKPQYRNQTRVFDLFGELKPHLQARQSELTINNSSFFAPIILKRTRLTETQMLDLMRCSTLRSLARFANLAVPLTRCTALGLFSACKFTTEETASQQVCAFCSFTHFTYPSPIF